MIVMKLIKRIIIQFKTVKIEFILFGMLIIVYFKGIAQEFKPELNLSGFVDVHAKQLRETKNIFGMGPFELDLESQIRSHVTGSAAMVFVDGTANLGVGFVDLHFFKESRSPSSPRGRIFTDPGFHLQIGQFDIPFGLDYLFYATPDRPTISPPLLTEMTFDGGWTDLGMRMFFTNPAYNSTVYIVNGFDTGYTLGGRLGIRPLENPFSARAIARIPVLEIGLSGVFDVDENSKKEFLLYGVDTEINIQNCNIIYEYVLKNHSQIDLKQQNFYLMLRYSTGIFDINLLSRYEEYQEKNVNSTINILTKRVSFGLTKEIYGGSILKIEHHFYRGDNLDLSNNKDVTTCQFVINF